MVHHIRRNKKIHLHNTRCLKPSKDNPELVPKDNENTHGAEPGTAAIRKYMILEFIKKHNQQKQNADCNKGCMDIVSEPPELASHSEEPQTVDDAIKCTSENVSSPTTNICNHQVVANRQETMDRPEALRGQELVCSIIIVNENKTRCGKDQSQSIKPIHACSSLTKTRSQVLPEKSRVSKIVDMFNKKESTLCNYQPFDQKVIRLCKAHETRRTLSYKVQCRIAYLCKSDKENRDQKKQGSPNRQEVSTAEVQSTSSWKTIYLLHITILFFIVTVVCLVW
ncbi:uncharacterized protein LOC143781451 isoform X2 [Ranitomeya variabilis]|uniref:uncharacterized protein LOC143781451 isoform X2 n=1 Tax=Ranitomeya variabilis TaxID=490064 RepID=UPI0040564E38